MALIDDLTAYWPLDETSGTREDVHGANDLTDHATVTSNPGIVGTAAQFTAANTEYLSRADTAALSTGDIDYSIVCWVRLDDKSTLRIIAAKYGTTTGGDREYILRYDSAADRFRFTIGGLTIGENVDADNFGSPSVDTWYMVAAWHDSVNNLIGISVNAGTPNTTAFSEGSVDGGYDFEMGYATQVGFPMDGRIDEFGFWKRVLSGAELTDLYNGGAGRDYAYISGGADTTPPTLSARTVASDGVTLTATLSESGCSPASGTGGFTLDGTVAAVTSWAISGTTLTLTLDARVYEWDTVTLSYARASTTDDIQDGAGNFLADFSDASVTNDSTQTEPLPSGGFALIGDAGPVF
jgi:hypothetical protein